MKVHRRLVVGTPVTQSPPNSPIVSGIEGVGGTQVEGEIGMQRTALQRDVGAILNVQLPVPVQPVRVALDDVKGLASAAAV